MSGYGAGVLLYTKKNDTIYYLLGKDNDKNWSDFGGRAEITDLTIEYTAAREFYEETLGSILTFQHILFKLKNNTYCIEDISSTGFKYYLYIVKIPYQEYTIYFKKIYDVFKYMESTSDISIPKYFLEKKDIQWINCENFEESLNTDVTMYPLRPIFKKTIKEFYSKINEYCVKN